MSHALSNETSRQVTAGVTKSLAGFAPDEDSALAIEVQQSIYLARQLQERANELQTTAERRQQAELDRMIQSPGDKATLMQLTDQAFRSRLPHRAADQIVHILDVQGIPRFFSALDRTLLKGFQSFGEYLPSVAMPLVKEKMQQETANVVLPAEQEHLRGYLRQRWEEGVRMNVNYLGEALLGEREAERRLKSYLQALQRPEIEVISVKISTIYSQISALAREHTIGVLCDRMELLYRAAAKNQFERRDGTLVTKFVYLDMEEYRDKEITAEVFMRTLNRPGLDEVRAGIALQAYIPDSFSTQQRITEWARQRVAQGGAPVTIRIVKGANMEMERVDASLHSWSQAPYQEKTDTDANYKRMLHYGMQAENLAAVKLGIASHNLFSLSYGLVLAVKNDSLSDVQFEMLEGMANHQRRALFELSQNMLLYAPACRQEDFINAIGYLVRRLDENTGEENFLRHAFRLEADSSDWQQLQQTFVDSFDRMANLSAEPRRKMRPAKLAPFVPTIADFKNVADTDWSLQENSEWGADLVEHWINRCDSQAAEVPLVIAGERRLQGKLRSSDDPSRPGLTVAKYWQAQAGDVESAVQSAQADPAGWRRLSTDERARILFVVADQIAEQRGDLMGAMLAEGGKILTQSDPEVSEAIDFCRFYAQTACEFDKLTGSSARGQGVVVVVSPWNFPLAIPCGGVAAALAAGNNVILKPASDTVMIAYRLCECFWQAGVPETTLQFMPCSGATVGQQLVAHPNVDTVILTGGTATALQMLAAKPTMNLLAETGGKNATIVTALADRDLAIKNVLHSAFGHSGQKCSATSLLILEEEVYHDTKFRELLCDAVESLQVGSAWQLQTAVGPLIRPPGGDLEKSLKELEQGESWAVLPHLHVDENPNLVSPGVKWGVQPDSFTHGTEFFGPLLGVMPARDLHEAIDLVNVTGYGLTAGLESLDDREQQLWQEGIRAGNLYINRPTTGAIVLRQPFGGMGKSAVGPGIKAGGPNYVAQLMQFPTSSDRTNSRDRIDRQGDLGDTGLDDFCEALRATSAAREFDSEEVEQIVAAAQSYEHWMAVEFEPRHDHFRLVGEDNYHRYLPIREMRVRYDLQDTLFELLARVIASRTAGCHTVVSYASNDADTAIELLEELTVEWAAKIEFVHETDEQLAEVVRAYQRGRVRFAGADRVPSGIRAVAAQRGVYLADKPVTASGRVELLWYFQEQSLSQVYHRYGNLGKRSDENRAVVL
ncbi:MAG: proline dehydrogenase family protein [Bythopirellula sp.]